MSKIADFIIYDYLGTKYQVDVYNENPTYVQPVVHFEHLDMNMIWDKADKENLWGIYTHRIDLTTVIKLSSHEVFIADLVAAKENDVWCTVTRTIGVTAVEVFRGYLLFDTITIENAQKPFIFNFSFTDSLGKASEVEHSVSINAALLPDTFRSLVYTIQLCLQDLKLDDIYGTASGLRTISKLIPDGFTISGDYYDAVAFPALGWMQGSDDDEEYVTKLVPISVEAVLTEICRATNSIFYYHEGVYNLENLDTKLDATADVYVYQLQRYSPPLTNGTLVEDYVIPRIEIDHSNYKIMRGGSITFLPPVRSIRCIYKLNSGNYLIGNLFDSDNFTTIQEILPVEAEFDGATPLTTFKLWSYYQNAISLYFDPADAYPVYSFYRYTIKINDYYLKRSFTGWDANGNKTYGDAVWEESPGYYYIVSDNATVYNDTSYYYNGITNDVLLIENNIPESGILELLIEPLGLIYQVGINSYDYVSDLDAEMTESDNLHNYLTFSNESESASYEVSYTATNDANNLKRLEHNGIFLEYGNINSRYSVKIWDGTDVLSTNGWKLGAGGDVQLLQMLTLESQVAFRQTLRRLYNMTLMHLTDTYLSPQYVIQYDSSPLNENIIQRLEHNCKTAESNIELMQFEKGSDPVMVTNESGVDIKAIGEDPRTTIITSETESETETGIVLLKVAVDGDTNIHITPLVGNYFEGDIIKIHSPSFRQPLEVMLNADAKEGDTVLNVFEVDTTYVYPIGSVVIPNVRPVYKDEYFYPVTTAYVELTTLTLPDETLLSLKAMRRKVRVWQNDLRMNYVTHGSAKLNYNDFSTEESTGRIHFKQALAGVRIFVEIEN